MPVTWLFAAALGAAAAAAMADSSAAEPAATCLSVTLGADGRFAKRRVEFVSGDQAADRRALAYREMLDPSRSIPKFQLIR